MKKRLALLGIALLVAGVLVVLAIRVMSPDPPADQQSVVQETAPGPLRCEPVQEQPVDASRHVDGPPIRYDAAPPAFGDHRSPWDYFARNFYQVEDRPEVAVLVHNLEHGYNILWYDETAAGDPEELAGIQELAEAYDGAKRDPSTALIAAPWTSSDGTSFPDGMHYALTHWYADPTDRTASRADEVGYTRYCTGLSDTVVEQWMQDYPLSDSPEGFPGNM